MSAAEDAGYCQHNVPRIYICNSCERQKREWERGVDEWEHAQAQPNRRKPTR